MFVECDVCNPIFGNLCHVLYSPEFTDLTSVRWKTPRRCLRAMSDDLTPSNAKRRPFYFWLSMAFFVTGRVVILAYEIYDLLSCLSSSVVGQGTQPGTDPIMAISNEFKKHTHTV
jgi:hypothetical protein